MTNRRHCIGTKATPPKRGIICWCTLRVLIGSKSRFLYVTSIITGSIPLLNSMAITKQPKMSMRYIAVPYLLYGRIKYAHTLSLFTNYDYGTTYAWIVI